MARSFPFMAEMFENCYKTLQRLHESWSFTHSGLIGFPLSPTAHAVGFILEPLRGNESLMSFRSLPKILVLTPSLGVDCVQPYRQKPRPVAGAPRTDWIRGKA